MRIAIIGNLPGPISIEGPGGTEVFVSLLIKNLIKRKHQVSLFASSDSDFKKNLIPFFNSNDISNNEGLTLNHYNNKIIAYKLALFSNLVKRADEFDIIHNNIYETFLFFPFSALVKNPVIHTVHNTFFNQPQFGLYGERFLPKKDWLIFVSKNALKKSYGIYNKKTIYNGIEVNNFPFNSNPSSKNLLWMGRAVPKKGIKEAIEIAFNLNRKINIITRVSSPEEEAFLSEILNLFEVKNKLFTLINIFKNISFIERVNLIKNAKLFLFPLQWEEPFGLVMIESMACGTPVVAFARGSVPEVIKDGETGFIVNPSDDDIRGDWIVKKTGIEGLIEAVEKIYSMPEKQYQEMRYACRKHVEKYFTVERMVDEYEKVYEKIKNF